MKYVVRYLGRAFGALTMGCGAAQFLTGDIDGVLIFQLGLLILLMIRHEELP